METRTNITIPNIKIETPQSVSFWRKVGIELTKSIRQRTLKGKDADNRPFKPYKKSTIKQRVKRGRSARVNLTDSGKMLGAMSTGIRPSKNGVRIQLAGEQGFKAYNIKINQRRNFFALNDEQVKKVIKVIQAWIVKKNK